MSDRPLYLLEPITPGAAWAPFAGVRPVAELRAGIWRIRERWEGFFDAETAVILGDHCAGFFEGAEPPVQPMAPVVGPCIVAASWFAPTGEPLDLDPDARRLTHAGIDPQHVATRLIAAYVAQVFEHRFFRLIHAFQV